VSSNFAKLNVSVVIIGRNEGVRLERCLQSVEQANWGNVRHELIYVDSRSTDGSVQLAQSLGAEVMLLDDASPCAAKARNLGWRKASGEYVLFLDGDTELHADFVPHALDILADPKLCAVWGHRRESRPSQSIYTRVLDLDWVYPTGRTLYFGGDVLVRRLALEQVNGFDPSLNAGEEPEMCARLRAAGWEIEHIDAPMTLHDLAVKTFRAYWLRAYRSGIAYAEVAERMRLRGDVLWQHEARRDYIHGIVFLMSPPLFAAALWLNTTLAAVLLALALLFLLRTARRCAWKAPGQWSLCMQYAIHAHFQKIPSLFGQFKWRRARRQQSEIALVDYKDEGKRNSFSMKAILASALAPLAWCQRVIFERWLRLWSMARLQEATGQRVDPSNVILGPIELHGTRNIRLGRGALIYPGTYLETQGAGLIIIGTDVVLSRGVHIVAFERVTLADGCMVGEYASLRDANHKLDSLSIRNSGHVSAAIDIGRNVWIGRGVTVLKGVQIGDNSVVAANAVVTKSVPVNQVVGGVPAKPLK
jgi:acetyltransferase-like isoleucine patch superfamily enzyme/GT2 family glycosyltransferase